MDVTNVVKCHTTDNRVPRKKEVDACLDPSRFTIRTVPARLRRAKGDPLRPVLDLEPDLSRALSRLSKRMNELL